MDNTRKGKTDTERFDAYVHPIAQKVGQTKFPDIGGGLFSEELVNVLETGRINREGVMPSGKRSSYERKTRFNLPASSRSSFFGHGVLCAVEAWSQTVLRVGPGQNAFSGSFGPDREIAASVVLMNATRELADKADGEIS